MFTSNEIPKSILEKEEDDSIFMEKIDKPLIEIVESIKLKR